MCIDNSSEWRFVVNYILLLCVDCPAPPLCCCHRCPGNGFWTWSILKMCSHLWLELVFVLIFCLLLRIDFCTLVKWILRQIFHYRLHRGDCVPVLDLLVCVLHHQQQRWHNMEHSSILCISNNMGKTIENFSTILYFFFFPFDSIWVFSVFVSFHHCSTLFCLVSLFLLSTFVFCGRPVVSSIFFSSECWAPNAV